MASFLKSSSFVNSLWLVSLEIQRKTENNFTIQNNNNNDNVKSSTCPKIALIICRITIFMAVKKTFLFHLFLYVYKIYLFFFLTIAQS